MFPFFIEALLPEFLQKREHGRSQTRRVLDERKCWLTPPGEIRHWPILLDLPTIQDGLDGATPVRRVLQKGLIGIQLLKQEVLLWYMRCLWIQAAEFQIRADAVADQPLNLGIRKVLQPVTQR